MDGRGESAPSGPWDQAWLGAILALAEDPAERYDLASTEVDRLTRYREALRR